jgi:hypothetical protein
LQRIESIIFDPVGCLTDGTEPYEDAAPVLAELKAMGIQTYIASSFPDLSEFASLDLAIFLTTTEEGLNAAKAAGIRPILMMNDPDEARRLAMLEPAGGIVSLHELPDFIRLVAAQNG